MKLKNAWNKRKYWEHGLKPDEREIKFVKQINTMQKPKCKKYKKDKTED